MWIWKIIKNENGKEDGDGCGLRFNRYQGTFEHDLFQGVFDQCRIKYSLIE